MASPRASTDDDVGNKTGVDLADLHDDSPEVESEVGSEDGSEVSFVCSVTWPDPPWGDLPSASQGTGALLGEDDYRDIAAASPI
ncbi:hypothetical protein BGZ99_007292 [Dissophora globulifera]|uniref:Uncharacterized protein n=1 Tax=Dissophora globulifera TaxID=979702 RepID=A0A9P6RTJ4_9FUNG|nr:hypothetical protein BGZ99_007292 [Dissophora globulifera]